MYGIIDGLRLECPQPNQRIPGVDDKIKLYSTPRKAELE